jgi:glycosyltransferase involved in cell wall biosynthesis
VRVLIDYRPALRSRTGVGEYVHQLVLALARRGGAPAPPSAERPAGFAPGAAGQPAVRLDLTIFSSSWKDRLDPGRFGPLPVTVIDRAVPVRVLNLAWPRLGWPTAESLARGRFDVVHSPRPLLIPARHAAQVVTIHDLDFLHHPERVRAEARRDYPTFARRHAHRAHQVIVISRYTAQQVELRLGVPAERISVCHPGVPDWVRARPRPPGRTEPSHILFLGTLEGRKNIGRLLDAYAMLLARRPEVPDLVLAGTATSDAAAWLARIIQPPLAGRVRHIGYVPQSSLQDLYDRAALLVLPSHDEGFGIPVLEAMAVGVPVVAADRGALPEVVGEAGLLVDPDDTSSLAAAMERILTDDEWAGRAVAQGKERARGFNWDATAESVVAAYERAIECRRDRAIGERR